MLSMFNESIEKIARITYSQQMSILINGLGTSEINIESVVIIAVNFLVAILLFAVAFKKKGLE